MVDYSTDLRARLKAEESVLADRLFLPYGNTETPAAALVALPLKTALAYTTEALRWVHVYGDALVDVFLSTHAALYKEGLLGPPPEGTKSEQVAAYRASAAARDELVASVELPEVLEPLNLQGWGT